MAELGLGTWAFGGHSWSHGWGPQCRFDSQDVIREALSHDVRFIDTAPSYGLGDAERIVGACLSDRKGLRPFVLTKCGQEAKADGTGFKINLTREFIRKDVMSSLFRLGLDFVDFVFLHYPSHLDDENYIAIDELSCLVDKGFIGGIGLSNFNLSQICQVCSRFNISGVQIKHSMLYRGLNTELAKFCKLNNIMTFGYQPLESGLLSGSFFRSPVRELHFSDWRSRNPLFEIAFLRRLTSLIELLSEISAKQDSSVATVVLAWTIKTSNCDVVLVGARSAKQLNLLLRWDEVKFELNDLVKIEGCIEELGLLRA